MGPLICGLPSLSERQLIKLAQDGDDDAMAALIAREQQYYEALVARRLGGRWRSWRTHADAADIVQSAALSLLQSGEMRAFKYRGPDSFKRWFSSWVINAARAFLRHTGRLRRDPRRNVGWSRVGSVPGDTSTASGAQMRAEGLHQLYAVLAALPDDERSAIHMRLQEVTYAEAAERLGIAVERYKSMLRRAKRMLREALGEWGLS